VLWCAAAAACVPLAAAEAVRPRLGYDRGRWSTVFPLGMLALSGLSVAGLEQWSWLRSAGAALAWFALAMWALVAAGALSRTAHGR
jgi:tellurite resistance protein TehA-like permease